MNDSTKPTLGSEYRNIGKGYVDLVDGKITSSKGELNSRIDIVPYTSYGERDVLGLNTIECLNALTNLLTEAQDCYSGYYQTCYQEDWKKYQDKLSEYNRTHPNN